MRNLDNRDAWMDEWMKKRQRVSCILAFLFATVFTAAAALIFGLAYLVIYLINSPAFQKFLGY